MSTSIASSINLSSLGLGTGMNNASVVNQLVAIASSPLTVLQSTAASVASASSALATFSASLNALQTAAKALADPAQFEVYSASSSAPQIVATTTQGASPGSHSVVVTQVAQAQISYSDPQASSTAALGVTGTLGLTVGATTVTLDVAATDSLADLATAIASSGAPVTAAVIYDGSRYRLDIQGTQTGGAGAISFAESGFSLGLGNPASTFQGAQDLHATIDGIAVTSSVNHISGAIPGVSLAVSAPTAGSATVNVLTSSSSLATQLSTFVSAYNTVLTTGHGDIGYGTTKPSTPMLAGDLGIRTTLGRFGGLLAGAVTTSDPTLTTVAAIGLTLNSDGTLTLDSAKLAAAIEADPSGVERLLVSSASQGMTGIMGVLSSTIDAAANDASSVLKSEAQYYTGRSKAITKQEATMQVRIDAYRTLLQNQFGAADMVVNTQRRWFGAFGGTGTFM